MSDVTSSTPSKVTGFLLREETTWPALREALAHALRVDETRILELADTLTSTTAVLVEWFIRDAGFRTDVTLYLKDPSLHELSSLEVGGRIAAVLDEDVLISPPAEWSDGANSPYWWVLLRPSGTKLLVHELEPESDNVIVDEASASVFTPGPEDGDIS